jgi:hypothetical protein
MRGLDPRICRVKENGRIKPSQDVLISQPESPMNGPLSDGSCGMLMLSASFTDMLSLLK